MRGSRLRGFRRGRRRSSRMRGPFLDPLASWDGGLGVGYGRGVAPNLILGWVYQVDDCRTAGGDDWMAPGKASTPGVGGRFAGTEPYVHPCSARRVTLGGPSADVKPRPARTVRGIVLCSGFLERIVQVRLACLALRRAFRPAICAVRARRSPSVLQPAGIARASILRHAMRRVAHGLRLLARGGDAGCRVLPSEPATSSAASIPASTLPRERAEPLCSRAPLFFRPR